jgi:integrase
MSNITLIDESNQAYQNFIESLKSQSTRYIYKYCIEQYLKYKNYNDISQLFSKVNPKWIESDIITYVLYLRKVKKVSYASLTLYSHVVIQFYLINDIQINKTKISRYYGEHVRVVKDRAYTTEEIQKILEFCDERTRCLVLLMSSAGMRIGAIPGLKVGNLEKIQDVYKIIVYERTKEEYYTFCTPECAAAIDNYLEYRKRYGEKITDNSPLIREQFDINDIEQIVSPRFVARDALMKVLDIVLNRSGLREKRKEIAGEQMRGRVRKGVARAHGFRKFATTNMVRAKVNAEAREMLLGHSIGLSDSYYRPDSSEILEEYMKAVDHLTINPENRLKKQVQELTAKTSDMDLLKAEIENIKTTLRRN